MDKKMEINRDAPIAIFLAGSNFRFFFFFFFSKNYNWQHIQIKIYIFFNAKNYLNKINY